MVSGAAASHTLIDTVVADPTRRDLVDPAARVDLVVAKIAEQRKEAHYRDRMSGTMVVLFALETYGACLARADRFLGEYVSLAFRERADRFPPLVCCARGYISGCLLHHCGR